MSHTKLLDRAGLGNDEDDGTCSTPVSFCLTADQLREPFSSLLAFEHGQALPRHCAPMRDHQRPRGGNFVSVDGRVGAKGLVLSFWAVLFSSDK